MSISTVSDDDMDSGIDGHVPSLEPLLEEDDYIVVDKDVNLASLTLGEPEESSGSRRGSLDGSCPGSLHGSPYGSPATRKKTLSASKVAAFRVGGDSNLESFGSYKESLAANWKPETKFRVNRRSDVSSESRRSCDHVSGPSSEFNKPQSVRKRTTEKFSDSRIWDNDAGRKSISKGKSKSKGKVPKNPSLTSFDKLVRNSKKKERRQRVNLWDSSSNLDSQSSASAYSKETTSASRMEVVDRVNVIGNKAGDNKNIMILPEIDEFRVEDADEDELWNGEEECEAGFECSEAFDDDKVDSY